MRNACAPCLYTLEGEPDLHPAMLVTMDGNQSLKLIDDMFRYGPGYEDTRDARSDIWLRSEEVDKMKDEVQNARKVKLTFLRVYPNINVLDYSDCHRQKTGRLRCPRVQRTLQLPMLLIRARGHPLPRLPHPHHTLSLHTAARRSPQRRVKWQTTFQMATISLSLSCRRSTTMSRSLLMSASKGGGMQDPKPARRCSHYSQ